MRAKQIPYTHEDDTTPDADMDGWSMVSLEDDTMTIVLDRIPESAASILVNAINGDQPGA